MAQKNPSLGLPLVLRPPTRIVPSGTLTLTAGTSAQYSGSNQRQDRIEFIITNLDSSNNLKLQKNGQYYMTIFASSNISLETNDDITVVNASSGSVQYEVCELYPDTGNFNQAPAPVPLAG